jgi:hypothetical protein
MRVARRSFHDAYGYVTRIDELSKLVLGFSGDVIRVDRCGNLYIARSQSHIESLRRYKSRLILSSFQGSIWHVGSTTARLTIFPASPFLAATYSGDGATVAATTETDCAGGVTHDNTVIGWLRIGSPERVSDDGNTLPGFYQTTDATGINRHEWLFQRVLQ